jgi:hypothetical protein
MNEWDLIARGCSEWVLGFSNSTSAVGPIGLISVLDWWPKLFNRLAGLANQDGRWPRERGRHRFPSAAMAAGRSSPSSTGTVLPASIHQAESMGRERRVRGFHLGDSGHGRRGLATAAAAASLRLRELVVGSLLAAGRGKGAAWGRSRRVQGCSLSKELDQDGLMGEIDGRTLLLGKERRKVESECGRR